jgi:hypothetical protein
VVVLHPQNAAMTASSSSDLKAKATECLRGLGLQNGFEAPIAAAVRNAGSAALFTTKRFNRKLFIMPYPSF